MLEEPVKILISEKIVASKQKKKVFFVKNVHVSVA